MASNVMRHRSKGEYPPDWPERAEAVKKDNRYKCERCKHKHDPASGYTLTVHHLDGDKSNCEPWNLAALCQRCHLKIQGRVFMPQVFMFEHSNWFKPHVIGYYKSLGFEVFMEADGAFSIFTE